MSGRASELAGAWRVRVEEAAAWLGARGLAGRVGLILGSGLGAFADRLAGARSVDFAEIPGFRATTVVEHRGRLVAGEAAGVPVVVLQGRLHPYEGIPFDQLLLPQAVLAGLGVGTVVLTNAAGGLNPLYEPGDFMAIRGHLDLHLSDPLRGLLRAPEGEAAAAAPRLALREVYPARLARLLVAAGATVGIPVHVGDYASVWGPSYETRAEIGMLRRAGCDAVGMSTAAEAALLARLGVAVAGISCITNPSREVGQPELSHADVVEAGARARDRLERLLLAFLPRLADIEGVSERK